MFSPRENFHSGRLPSLSPSALVLCDTGASMSKYKSNRRRAKPEGLSLAAIETLASESVLLGLLGRLREHIGAVAVAAFVFLLVIGMFARNGWLPHTDTLTGKRTGWFGRGIPQNAPSSWNPFAPPLPSPTPQLSREYIYAGSRLLAVEDANASAIPPEDLAVWRPSNGNWLILGSQQLPPVFGLPGDTPVQGDYDGDGRTDFAVRRPGISNTTWYVLKSSDNLFYGVPFGVNTDVPAVGDYDGDGKTDIAIWRPSTQDWSILQSSTNTTVSIHFGTSGDIPAPADYDGDGRADLAVWHPTTRFFESVNTSNGVTVSVPFGDDSGAPVCADYDGDGKANYAVWSEGNWIIMNAALTGKTTTGWGSDTDYRVQNDYDGDGKVDLAVWRPAFKSATWLIRQSHDLSTRSVNWGVSGDIPVPAVYRR